MNVVVPPSLPGQGAVHSREPGELRLKLSPAATEQGEEETLLFQMSRQFLEVAHLLSHGMQMEPASVMIVETVRVGSMERANRLNGRSGGKRHAMSRRAVAVATGLSRETVRRRVKRLVEEGVLREDVDGSLSVVAVDEEELRYSLKRYLSSHVTLTNQLIGAGLIETSCPTIPALRSI